MLKTYRTVNGQPVLKYRKQWGWGRLRRKPDQKFNQQHS